MAEVCGSATHMPLSPISHDSSHGIIDPFLLSVEPEMSSNVITKNRGSQTKEEVIHDEVKQRM